MNKMSSALATIAIMTGLASSACFAEKCKDTETEQDGVCITTLSKYKGQEFTQNVPYTAGGNLEVLGVNGQIKIVAGSAGQVAVTFKPFTFRGSGQDTEAKSEMDNNLILTANADAGNVKVSASTTGGSKSLGAEILIQLPPEFDGALRAWNEVGGVNVDSVGAATRVDITNNATAVAGCTVVGAPSVTFTYVHCSDSITVSGVSDTLDIVTNDLLDGTVVDVSLAQITAASLGGSITLKRGTAKFGVPSAAAFTVQAQAPGGTVDFGGFPTATCAQAEASAASKSLTCGTATAYPNYTIQAGEDTTFPGNVVVTYH